MPKPMTRVAVVDGEDCYTETDALRFARESVAEALAPILAWWVEEPLGEDIDAAIAWLKRSPLNALAAKLETCEACDGSGSVTKDKYGTPRENDCPTCGGTGRR